MGFVTADEGETLAVRVIRNGQAIDTASATFSLSLISTVAEDVDLITDNEVFFTSGQRVTEILLNITDDDIPEIAEQFTLVLLNTSGKQHIPIGKSG